MTHNFLKQKGELELHIREFQNLMRRLYFNRDKARGSTGTYEWLTDEVAELGEALEAHDTKGIEEEFADVIAWLSSLANVVDVDLEKAALTKYNDRCPKCGRSPCECAFKERKQAASAQGR